MDRESTFQQLFRIFGFLKGAEIRSGMWYMMQHRLGPCSRQSGLRMENQDDQQIFTR